MSIHRPLAAALLFLGAVGTANAGLLPGSFRSGLDTAQAEQLAAETQRVWPGAVIEMTYDVGYGSWTLVHRPSEGGNDSGEVQ
jgi:hypothetical protein